MTQAPTSDEAIRQAQIVGAVAKVDPQQIAISRLLTHVQRVQQALSMIELAEQVAGYRLRQRHPELSKIAALRICRSGESDD